MIRTVKHLLIIALLILPVLIITPSAKVQAQGGAFEDICLNDDGSSKSFSNGKPEICSDELKDPSDTNPVVGLLANVTRLLGFAVGIIGFIMIVMGGFRYATSAGNPEQTKAARQLIVTALVGMLVFALAAFFINFVASFFT